MTAEVLVLHRFQAYCRECAWWGFVTEDETEAVGDGDEHDCEEHDDE